MPHTSIISGLPQFETYSENKLNLWLCENYKSLNKENAFDRVLFLL